MKIRFIILFLFIAGLCAAQQPATIKLTQLETAKVVESSRAGQIGLTNSSGKQRYAQYVEIDLTPIAFVPTYTGNVANFSEFVVAPDSSRWYIDWQGRGYRLSASGGLDKNGYYGGNGGNGGDDTIPSVTKSTLTNQLTFYQEEGETGGLVPIRIQVDEGNEPDFMSFYFDANTDSLLVHHSDFEWLLTSSSKLVISSTDATNGAIVLQAADDVELSGDSIKISTVANAFAAEKTFLTHSPNGYVTKIEGISGAQINANAIDSTKVANGGLGMGDINQSGASSGQVLTWNGSSWVPRTASGGALTNGNATTAAGTAVNWGGATTGNVTVTGNGSHTIDWLNLGGFSSNSKSFVLRQNYRRFLHQTGGYSGTTDTLFNLSLGYLAGQSFASASDGYANTFIGTKAGMSVNGNSPNATSNTLIGAGSGEIIVTGSYNTVVGTRAGSNTAAGLLGLTATGHHAGLNNTADNNTFYGRGAGEANTSGLLLAIGSFAGAANVSGTGNTYIGYSAGRLNVLGVQNTFVGHNAGVNTINGASEGENTFIGYNAGTANTIGQFNSFFGRSAGGSNTSGNSNIFFGRTAGITNTIGDDNVFIGVNAGELNLSGTGNTYIGRTAGSSQTTGSNNIFLGKNVDAASGVSNVMMLGRALYVTSQNSLASSSVGIGTVTPGFKLDVVGKGAFTDLRINTSTPSVAGQAWVATNASGDGSWQSVTGTTPLSSLTAAIATNTIDNLNFAQTWNWSTATSQNAMTWTFPALTVGFGKVMTANAITDGTILQLSTSNNSADSDNGLLSVLNTGTSVTGRLATFQANSTSGSGLTLFASGKASLNRTSATAQLHLGPNSTAASSAQLKFEAGTNMTAPEAGAIEYNGQFSETKASGLRYARGGSVKSFFTDAGNSGTTETDLYSYTTPADFFAVNGDRIEATFALNLALSATATKDIAVYFAGNELSNTGDVVYSGGGSCDVTVTIVRVSSSVVRYSVVFQSQQAPAPIYGDVGELTGLTLSGTNVFKITGHAGGTGAGSDNVIARLGTIDWFPAGDN